MTRIMAKSGYWILGDFCQRIYQLACLFVRMLRYKNSYIAHYEPVFVPCLRTKIRRNLVYSFPAITLGTLFLLVSAEAADDFPMKEPHQSLPPTFEDHSWKELGVKIPPYPKDSDLLEIHVNHPGSRFQYFIDAATVTVGKDGIVNYTLVARSDRGAKNVAFERMHCGNMDYKVAAYGTSKGEFRPVRKQRWRSIKESSNIRYRLDLWEYYLCDTETRRNRSVKQIIDAIRYYREDRKDRGLL